MNVASEAEQADPANAANAAADRIIEEVLAGDTEAFAGLIRLFQESVWRIAAAFLRDRDATENVVQQVFVDAYLHLDQYERGTDFGAWIRTVARNRLRKDLRTATREDRRLAHSANGSPRSCGPRPAASRRLGRLHGGASRLSRTLAGPRCRTDPPALRNSRASFEAIAAEQGQSPEAVQRMILRIRFRLRDCIQQKLSHT